MVFEDPPEPLFLQEALKKMNKLRMLHRIQIGFSMIDDPSIKDGSIEYLPNSLRCFIWEGYFWESLPANFEPKRLIHLNLGKSSLGHLWTETKDLRCLRTLDLSYPWRLKQSPDFTGMPNLEYVDLSFCKSLEDLHSSLGNCNKLIQLGLNGCRSLKRFPQVNVECLEYLDLRSCYNLKKFPEIVGRMKPEFEIFQYTGGTRIREVPSSIQYQTHLTKLNLNQKYSKLDPCFESLPKEIGNIVNLEWLDASNTLISQPPPSIVRLNKLKFLNFAKDNKFYQKYFVFPRVAEGLRSLEKLNLRYCNLKDGGLPEDIGCLSSLKELNLTGNKFCYLPQSIGQLGGLQCLNLSHCARLKEFPDFTGMLNLKNLDMSYCMKLEEVHHSVGYLEKLIVLYLSHCERLKELPDFTGMLDLEILDVSDCTYLEVVHQSVGYLKKLSRLNLSRCQRLKRCPALRIDSLKYLNLQECSSLEKFPEILPGSMKMHLEILMLDRVMRDTSHSFQDTLIQNISSNSLSQRVFTIQNYWKKKIPSWFDHQGMDESVLVKLPENWYGSDNFLGVAVCYYDRLIKITAELIPFYDDGMTHELSLCNHEEFHGESDTFEVLLPSLLRNGKGRSGKGRSNQRCCTT